MGNKLKAIALVVFAIAFLSVSFTNCAKSLPADASSNLGNVNSNSTNPPPQPTPPLVASYLPAIVPILSSTTVNPEGGRPPYTLTKVSGAGVFDPATRVYTATNLPEEAIVHVADSAGNNLDVRISIVPLTVTAAEQSFASPGAYQFTVPTHNTLVVEVWGAGAGGQHCGVNGIYPFCLYGGSGGNSSFGVNMLFAQGGQGVAGGTASGGTMNIRGENGNWNGTNCPGAGGGAGGPAGILFGTRGGSGPGGGGNALCLGWGANGGGGGGYSRKEYLAGELSVGSVIPGVVGGGGGVGGAHGLVKISWR